MVAGLIENNKNKNYVSTATNLKKIHVLLRLPLEKKSTKSNLSFSYIQHMLDEIISSVKVI